MCAVSLAQFEIEILSQGWLGDGDPDLTYDPASIDMCSHGAISLTIGGRLIARSDDDREYGISESALALLRTLESNHSPDRPVAERLIFHGCGGILMMGCPVGIDWSVSHHGGHVLIDRVMRYDTTDETKPVRFPGLAVQFPEDEYCREIVGFARQAKDLFNGVTKEISDDYDQEQYEAFWGEYEARFSRSVQWLATR
jgi:hypothetical protein